MILLTTSRRPTGRMRTFVRDLAASIPDVVRVNRGKMSMDGVAENAIGVEADRVMLVDRWHGGPGKLSLFRVSSDGLVPVAPVMLLTGIRLRRELDEKAKRVRASAVTFEPETSVKLERVAVQLSNYLGLPVVSFDEASESHRASLHVSFDSSHRLQATFLLLDKMVEIGPRLTMSRLIWKVTS